MGKRCIYGLGVVLSSAGMAGGITGCSEASSEGPSELATGSVAQALNAAPKVTDFVFYASNSISHQAVLSLAGDVGVQGAATGATLVPGFELALGTTTNATHVDLLHNVIAPRIQLNLLSTVGDVEGTLTNRGGVFHKTYGFPSRMPPLPLAAPVVPGSANLTVNTVTTLNPGSWKDVTVGPAATLILNPGLYQVASLTVGTGGQVVGANGAGVELRIAGRLTMGVGAEIEPALLQTASKFRIEVNGINGTTGGLSETPAAASIGNFAELNALVLVPNGTLDLGTSSSLTGAFAAKDINVRALSNATFQNGFPTCADSCDDGNPCTTDGCGTGGTCLHLLQTGTTCSDGNACTQTDTCQAGTCVGTNPVSCAASDECHLAGTCSPSTGTCTTPPKDEGTPCTLAPGSQQALCQSGTCVQLTAPPPQVSRAPRTLPHPPRDKGCYLGTANGWLPVDCTTQADLDKSFPHPQVYNAIVPAAPPVSTIPFEFGELEATITSFDSEQDVSRDGTTSTNDALSIQLNTNTFTSTGGADATTGAAGDTGWVQFVVQTNGSDSSVCLWNVDSTVACAKTDKGVCIGDGYRPTCLGGSTDTRKNRVGERPGHFQALDYATVGGSVYKDSTNAAVIGLVARFSWYDPKKDFVDASDPDKNGNGLYSVVVGDSLGLGGNWKNVNGTLMGVGGASKATFGANSAVLTRMLAGSCVDASSTVASIPWPGACPTQPQLLPHTALGTASDTAESNNLTQVGAINALASVTPDLVFTEYLASQSGMCQGSSLAYVRDYGDDTGAVPSNTGGQAFWESPDLFIVPAGATVDVDATPSETVVQPGQSYDFWVRVNNDYSCNDVTGVKARVNVADPSALSTNWDSGQVTGNQYLGDLQADGSTTNGGGITVTAGKRGLVGPFHWVAPSTNLGDGHKCVLASIQADGQAAPADPTDAPKSPQVAQRNLQLTECAFPLTNGTTTDGNLTLTLTVPKGITPNLSNVGMTFTDPNGDWSTAWSAGAGAKYSVTHDAGAGTTTVQLGQASVTLTGAVILAGETETANGLFNLSTGDASTTLQLDATLKDPSGTVIVHNGGTCVQDAPPLLQ